MKIVFAPEAVDDLAAAIEYLNQRVGRIIQRVTIQFETGDPVACRGVAGGVGR